MYLHKIISKNQVLYVKVESDGYENIKELNCNYYEKLVIFVCNCCTEVSTRTNHFKVPVVKKAFEGNPNSRSAIY